MPGSRESPSDHNSTLSPPPSPCFEMFRSRNISKSSWPATFRRIVNAYFLHPESLFERGQRLLKILNGRQSYTREPGRHVGTPLFDKFGWKLRPLLFPILYCPGMNRYTHLCHCSEIGTGSKPITGNFAQHFFVLWL